MVEENAIKSKRKALRIVRSVLFSLVLVMILDLVSGIFILKENYQSFRIQHHYYHHGLLSNQETLAAWGSLVYPFYTNSLGFVDSASYKVALKSDNKRILILGDSHSEGVGVPYLKTFAGRLATSLKDDNIEVLNASCISYSQKIEYLKARYIIEEQGLNFDQMFVLVDISDMQNELVYEHFQSEENTIFRRAGIKLKTLLKKRSAIYSVTKTYVAGKRNAAFYETAQVFDSSRNKSVETNSLELYATFFTDFDDNTMLSNPQFHGVAEWYYDDYFRDLADRGIDMAQDYILQLKELCAQYKIDLTISVHPWQKQILEGAETDYYTDKWENFCIENKIGFVNMFPLFINEENAVVVNQLYYIHDDNHWNEFGHEKVASFLLDYFSKENPVDD